MLFWLAGCLGPTMVEVPGAMAPGVVDWAWPAEVPSLAGCTWTERSLLGADETTWTYDPEGRLTSEVAVDGTARWTTAYTWRRGCLTGFSREGTAVREDKRGGTEETTTSEVHQYTCDRHDNKVAWEQVAVASDGSFLEIDGRTFVNSYDALGQLAVVETWKTSDSPLEVPLFVDNYTWNSDGQPLVQVHEAPVDGAKTTWTWWWDHNLLLGRDEVGTGADVYMSRTYEGRRLTGELVESDADGNTTSSWEYTDPPGPFPIATVSGLAGIGFEEREVDVSCAE